MRKSDLHSLLQATAVPIPGKGGVYAIVPLPVPASVDVPECAGAFRMAHRELDLLKTTLSRCAYATRLLRSLNRREAVASSQIEGTRTSFDELLLYEMDLGDDAAPDDADAGTTLAYVDAATHGEAAVAARGQAALDLDLIRTLHARLMAAYPSAAPGRFRTLQNHIGGLRIEQAVFVP
ncbi:MAG: Fic/DOC family N-terminal domain-containing protein, partial [Gallionellaceae bacterium]|nr:Fic/DOC family N-terminal domain-containing protein [Gallionellaceae bacterium]